MKVLRAGLASLAILASGCVSPGRVNYSDVLESSYTDSKPVLLFEKRKELKRMNFKEYLADLESYLNELNEGRWKFDSKEFGKYLSPFHSYLEVVSGETLPLDRVIVTDDSKILPGNTIGKYDPELMQIYLLYGELSMQTYTHEFGHHTDLYRDMLCRFSFSDLCKSESGLLRVRAELVAEAFQLYVASDLLKYNKRLALFFAAQCFPYSLEGLNSFKGLMKDVESFPAKRYLAADVVTAVLYAHHFKDFKKTWEFVRKKPYGDIFSLFREIEKGHASFEKMVEKSFFALQDKFEY